jgi:Tol biopolymer transport system component
MRLSLDETPRVTTVLQTRFNEGNGELSPDGHWLAYESDSVGHSEIYVRPYPETAAGQWEISTSTGGGSQPVWARGGKELFYLAPDGSLMSVRVVSSSRTWRADAPVKLFQGRHYVFGPIRHRMYDVSPDGQRFLMLKPANSESTAASPSIVIVQNFAEELKARVPGQ